MIFSGNDLSERENMEFKRRLVRANKRADAVAKKDNGFIRIKIRGRKRWVKVDKSEKAE